MIVQKKGSVKGFECNHDAILYNIISADMQMLHTAIKSLSLLRSGQSLVSCWTYQVPSRINHPFTLKNDVSSFNGSIFSDYSQEKEGGNYGSRRSVGCSLRCKRLELLTRIIIAKSTFNSSFKEQLN